MSTEPFTDEILSAIIDGEADETTVAAVAGDPAAAARLAQLRKAVAQVATPVPDATPERRSASIAAAMAAATPAPEVSSLAAARHERTLQQPKASPQRGRWLAAVAAAIVLVVTIPLLVNFGGSDADETASTSFDTGDSSADSASDDTTDDAAEVTAEAADGLESAESDATDEDASESIDDSATDDVMDEEDAMDEPAAVSADDSPVDTDAPAEQDFNDAAFVANRLLSAPTVDSVENVQELILVGAITPRFTLEQAVEAGVSPDCGDSLAAELSPDAIDSPLFDITFLDEDGASEPQLLLIQFHEDGTTTTLDAEDCVRLG